jgi:hypothetical protein
MEGREDAETQKTKTQLVQTAIVQGMIPRAVLKLSDIQIGGGIGHAMKQRWLLE